MIRLSRFGWLLLAAVAAWGLAPPQDSRAQNVITDPSNSFSMGLNAQYGEIYDYGTGIGFKRISDGYDPIAPGSPREAWGVSAGATVGYADQADYGNQNLTTSTGTGIGANSANFVNYLNAGSGNLLQVTQNYSFVAANIVQIAVSITNDSGVSQAVQYARNVDWDIAPTTLFHENTTVNFFGGPVTAASYNGFENPSPLVAFGYPAIAGVNNGPADNGTGFQLNLGTLAAGASTSFDVYYGLNTIGQTPVGLDNQLTTLAPGLWALSTGFGDDGNINTATNSIVLAVAVVPEPSTFVMAGIAGLAFMGYAWRRRRHGGS